MERPDKLYAPLSLDIDYTTIEEALVGLTAIEESFRLAKDRRAVFVGAYVTITSALHQAIGAGQFEDSVWVQHYLVQFARLYVEALRAFERGALEQVPEAWRVAFEMSGREEGLVLQHLLLGINAHINYDLAVALSRAGIDPNRTLRYNDHTVVNDVLKQATNALQDHVIRLYSPALNLLDELFGQWDEEFACLMVSKARDTAWHHCLALVGCTCEEDQIEVLRQLDEQTGALARLIANPYTSPFELIMVLRTTL